MGAADHCDLTLKEEAILAYIEREVDPADLGFLSSLNAMTLVGDMTDSEWSGLEKTVQCRAVENTARANGFID